MSFFDFSAMKHCFFLSLKRTQQAVSECNFCYLILQLFQFATPDSYLYTINNTAMKSGIISSLLLFSVFISACNSSSAPDAGSGTEQPAGTDSATTVQSAAPVSDQTGETGKLYGTKWILGEMNGKEVTVGEGQGQQPYISFSQNDQRAQGNGGCNSFGAAVTTGPAGMLKMKDAVSTRMACGSLSLESDYFNMLEKVETYSIEADVLSFFDTEKNPLARFKPGN